MPVQDQRRRNLGGEAIGTDELQVIGRHDAMEQVGQRHRPIPHRTLERHIGRHADRLHVGARQQCSGRPVDGSVAQFEGQFGCPER